MKLAGRGRGPGSTRQSGGFRADQKDQLDHPRVTNVNAPQNKENTLIRKGGSERSERSAGSRLDGGSTNSTQLRQDATNNLPTEKSLKNINEKNGKMGTKSTTKRREVFARGWAHAKPSRLTPHPYGMKLVENSGKRY